MIDCAITENIVIEKMEDGLYYSVMFRPEKDVIDYWNFVIGDLIIMVM